MSRRLLTRVEKLHINGVALLGRGTDDEIISECRSLPSTWPKLKHKTKSYTYYNTNTVKSAEKQRRPIHFKMYCIYSPRAYLGTKLPSIWVMKSVQVLTSVSLTSLQTRRVLIVGTVSSALLQQLLRRDGAMLRYSNRSD